MTNKNSTLYLFTLRNKSTLSLSFKTGFMKSTFKSTVFKVLNKNGEYEVTLGNSWGNTISTSFMAQLNLNLN